MHARWISSSGLRAGRQSGRECARKGAQISVQIWRGQGRAGRYHGLVGGGRVGRFPSGTLVAASGRAGLVSSARGPPMLLARLPGSWSLARWSIGQPVVGHAVGTSWCPLGWVGEIGFRSAAPNSAMRKHWLEV